LWKAALGALVDRWPYPHPIRRFGSESKGKPVLLVEKRLRLRWQIPLPGGGRRRLREAIIYVVKRCHNAEHFGKIKLNKILWRADFTAFLERGKPVTGTQYLRLQYGPAPLWSGIMLGDMQAAGLIELEPRRVIDYDEMRPVLRRDVPIRFLSESDLAYLDKAIEHYWNMTGRETSDDSHGVAWRTRDDGDPIPYESAYLSNRPLSEKMKNILSEKGRVLGWHSR
jgi:hypothetical protein